MKLDITDSLWCAKSSTLLDLEAQKSYEVQFSSYWRHNAPTRAFHRPQSLLRQATVFDDTMIDGNTIGASEEKRHNVLVIGHELHKGRLLCFVLMVGIVGLGICVGIGANERNPELGAWISAGVFGMLAVVQGAV